MIQSSSWFSPLQGTVLAAAISAAAIALRRAASENERSILDRLVMILVLTPLFAKFFLLVVLPGSRQQALPLHVCDVAGVLCAIALVTRNAVWATPGVLTAVLLSSVAICQPDLGSGPSSVEQLLFWMRHFSLALVAGYLLFALRIPLTWRGYMFWTGLVISYTIVALLLNSLLGTNFGYLRDLPSPPAVLEAIGPWPERIVAMVLLPLILGAVLTALSVRLGQCRSY